MGMARQVAFLLAVAQKPDLLILDEPAANLDVVARRDFLDELLDLLREDGKTVFLSSHILSDVERVADEIGIIAQGRLKISEPLDRLKETVKKVRFYGFEKGANGFAIPDAFQFSKTRDEVLATLRVEDEGWLRKLAAEHRCQYEVIPSESGGHFCGNCPRAEGVNHESANTFLAVAQRRTRARAVSGKQKQPVLQSLLSSIGFVPGPSP